MYMFIFKACETKVLRLQPQILKKAQLTASPFRSRCLPPSSGRCPYNYWLGENIDPDTEYSSGFVATQKRPTDFHHQTPNRLWLDGSRDDT